MFMCSTGHIYHGVFNDSVRTRWTHVRLADAFRAGFILVCRRSKRSLHDGLALTGLATGGALGLATGGALAGVNRSLPYGQALLGACNG